MTRKPQTDALILNRWAPLLVLLPVSVAAANTYLVTAYGWQDPVSDISAQVSSPRLEAMARSRVLIALLPFMLVATLAALHLAHDYLALMGSQVRRRLLLPIILFGAFAAFSIVSATLASPGPEGAVGSNMFDLAFAGLFASGSELPLRAVLDRLVLIFTVFLSLGAGSLIVGTISCLAEPPRHMSSAQRERLCEIQRRRLDVYLYASAFLLVTGLFFIDACMRWPASFSTSRDVYMEHVDALMLGNGIYYSTIIASYYVPAAVWVRGFPASAATQSSDEAGEPHPWSPSRMLKAFLALISPAIAGVLAQLIESLGI